MRKTFKLVERQDKGGLFRDALKNNGWQEVHLLTDAGILVVDYDARGMVRQSDGRRPVFVHPHAARSYVLWDGITEPRKNVTCNFVQGEGCKRVMQTYGYPRPIEVCGWTYTKIRPFKPTGKVEKVLFAPVHPDASGQLDSENVRINSEAFRALLSLDIPKLTVRTYLPSQISGISRAAGVTYVDATLTNRDALRAIEGYDLVVSSQTFAYLSISLGIPTVMFGEDAIPHSGNTKVKNWAKYKDEMMFPLDLLRGGRPRDIVEEAVTSDEKIREWRDGFIGPQFDDVKFVSTVESYL